MEVKVKASKEGNKTMRTWAKIMLQFALLGVICLFLPMCAISYLKLRKLEEKQTI